MTVRAVEIHAESKNLLLVWPSRKQVPRLGSVIRRADYGTPLGMTAVFEIVR